MDVRVAKLAIIGLVLCLLVNCEDLERNNILDPKNPGSHRPQIVLAEAFVNDGTGYPYSGYALEALETLATAEEYQSRLIVLEYHYQHSQWPDQYGLDKCNKRYNELDPPNRGIPDVMFNGLSHREQGASSVNTALERYQQAVDRELDKTGYFTIEADMSISGTEISIDVTIARLGSSDANNVVLNAVICEDLQLPRYHFVVRDIFPVQNIARFGRGEIKNFTMVSSPINITDTDNIATVIFIQEKNSLKKEVLQATKIQ